MRDGERPAHELSSRPALTRPAATRCRFRGHPTWSKYRDINISIDFEDHICEIQIQLAAILSLKSKAHAAYEMIQAFDLEDELDDGGTRVCDLAAACTPGTRVALGALRFLVCVFSGGIGATYCFFGWAYDTHHLRWLGAVVFGSMDVSGKALAGTSWKGPSS